MTKIAELEVGRPIEGTYAVTRSSRRLKANGDPYLVLQLSDSTGHVEGKVWRDADHFATVAREGDTVKVVATPGTYNGKIQLDIRRLERLDGGSDVSFVPVSSRAVDDIWGELDFLIEEIGDPGIKGLCQAVWTGGDGDLLKRSPATVDQHHSWLGGLMEHTVNVASVCLAAAERSQMIDRDLLLGAAILHDIGRAREIEVGRTIAAGDRALEGHIMLGHEMILNATSFQHEKSERWSRLIHTISMHHGPLDRCRTSEARVLYLANMIDISSSER